MEGTRDVKWLKSLDTNYIECRSIRHTWAMNRFSAVNAEESAKEIGRAHV